MATATVAAVQDPAAVAVADRLPTEIDQWIIDDPHDLPTSMVNGFIH